MSQRYAFEFGEWYPDLEPYAHQGLTTATNVYHDVDGYKPVPGFATAGVAATGGGVLYSPVAVLDPSGVDKIIAVESVLPSGPTSFVLTSNYGTGWTTTTQATTSAVSNKGGFSAAQLESSIVFCTPDIAEGTWISTDGGSTFTTADLGGLSGKVVGAFSNFIILGNISDADGEFAIRWSAIGDPSDWPTPNTDDARSKQSGREYLNPKFGEVTGIFGNEFYGLIFQERAITKATYVGGDVVFAFDTYEERRGAIRGAAVQAEERVYFCDGYGFYVTDGSSVVPIGEGKVDETYAAKARYVSSTVDFGAAAHAHKENLIAWLVDADFGKDVLFFNYRTGRWSVFSDLKGIDGLFSPVIDWDVNPIVGMVDGSKLAGFTGSSPDAVLETAERPLVPFKRSVVQGVRPLINYATGTSVSVEIGVRNDQSTSVSYTTLSAINSRTKMHNGRVEGRYHRAKFTISGGFDIASGAEAHFDDQGEI